LNIIDVPQIHDYFIWSGFVQHLLNLIHHYNSRSFFNLHDSVYFPEIFQFKNKVKPEILFLEPGRCIYDFIISFHFVDKWETQFFL